MDLEGRRSSYSIARVLEEVQEQKTKEQQLQKRQSGLITESEVLEASSNSSASGAQEAPEEELQFKPGFVSQLLGKFGGQQQQRAASSSNSAEVAAGLRKASSTQNLSGTATFGGVVLRRQPVASTNSSSSTSATGPATVARRRSQDVSGNAANVNGNGGSHVFAFSGGNSSPASPATQASSSPSGSSTASGNRVFIIPKTSASPVVRRWQQQQQQQAPVQKPTPPSEPIKPSPSPTDNLKTKTTEQINEVQQKPEVTTESIVTIPSDSESLPIKNLVQSKRSMFEQPQQQQSVVSHAKTNGGAGLGTTVTKVSPSPHNHQHQPVIGRSGTNNATRQILPRSVEIVKATSPKMPTQQSSKPSTPPQPQPAKFVLPSKPSVVPAPTVAMVTKPTTTVTATTPANKSSNTKKSDSDGYGFGLPVPQLKSSLPFNGENLKRVALNDRAVVAMRKAGKSWFFGTDVAEAPEGSIAVKLTPNDRPFSLTEDGDSSHAANDVDELTEERRAQTTVWDHVRNADSGRQRVDPGLAAEARRLMASAAIEEGEAGDDRKATSIAARRNKKMLCFKRDSVLEETFEYQSEKSLIEELRITPDYPTDPFEPSDSPSSPTIDEEEEFNPTAASAATDEAKKDAVKEADGDAKVANGTAGVGLRPAGTPTALANYNPKLADEFVWGARNSAISEDKSSQEQPSSSTAAVGDIVDAGAVDDPDAQWSASASADLLF
ncbi:hypothetical protein BOX15_Mlig014103g1 [Macrostomum lignano]|uniref:Uncharacterized protein n=2 Tax=Macrostomum lignano TaxID=282301 RepID=A0A267FD92_9PLAT|nr:hypothetical protein BOX15_Mlig014103g1 [Macrostomum lignano]